MFQIKICGVTDPADAKGAVEAGADAIGLNFYPPSSRSVDFARAAEVAAAIPPPVAKVGVFVNSPLDDLIRIHDELGLDVIQLHGEEPPELLEMLGGRTVLKAFRCGESGLGAVLRYLQQCRSRGRLPEGLLIDALQPGSYGGTGRVFDWRMLAAARPELESLPVVLAGGLSPDNVAEAIATCGPDAVDTASGVESSPGRKDPRLVRSFVEAARAAFSKRASET